MDTVEQVQQKLAELAKLRDSGQENPAIIDLREKTLHVQLKLLQSATRTSDTPDTPEITDEIDREAIMAKRAVHDKEMENFWAKAQKQPNFDKSAAARLQAPFSQQITWGEHRH